MNLMLTKLTKLPFDNFNLTYNPICSNKSGFYLVEKTMLQDPLFLNAFIKDTRKKINKEKEECDKVIDILSEEAPAYSKYLNNLNNEINELRTKLNLKINMDSEIERNQENNKSNKNSNTKLLYKKISQKCHPDKTDDDKLHELFKEAKLAYDENNYSLLADIYSQFYNDLELDNSELEKEYQKLKDQLDKIHTSFGYVIKENFNKGNITTAREYYLKFLFDQIKSNEALRDQLVKQINN